jgi:PST family polysaccharide transporter
MVALAQAFGIYVTLLVEFGFNLSATRDVSRHRDDGQQLSHILADVLGAKLMLAVTSVGAVFVLQFFLRQFRDNPIFLWAGVMAGIAQAFSMAWFYQGLERMKIVALLGIVANAIGTFGVFLLVRSPQHAWRVLVIQAFGAVLGSAVLLAMAYREVPFRLPTLRGSWATLLSGGNMFFFRSAVSLYTTMNTLMVGFLGGPIAVGYFAGAEKLCRAMVGLQQPLFQSLYPKLIFLRERHKERAVRAARIGTFLLLGCGGICSTVLFFAASLLVRLLLGPKYTSAIPIVRILAFLPIGVALASAIAYQWMLPLRLDRQMTIAAVLGGTWCVIVGASLYPFFGSSGVAIGTVTAEFVVSGYYIYALRACQRHRTDANGTGAISVD